MAGRARSWRAKISIIPEVQQFVKQNLRRNCTKIISRNCATCRCPSLADVHPGRTLHCGETLMWRSRLLKKLLNFFSKNVLTFYQLSCIIIDVKVKETNQKGLIIHE